MTENIFDSKQAKDLRNVALYGNWNLVQEYYGDQMKAAKDEQAEITAYKQEIRQLKLMNRKLKAMTGITKDMVESSKMLGVITPEEVRQAGRNYRMFLSALNGEEETVEEKPSVEASAPAEESPEQPKSKNAKRKAKRYNSEATEEGN